MNLVNINIERPNFDKTNSSRNIEVMNRWISDTSDKLNYLIALINSGEIGGAVESDHGFDSSDTKDGNASYWTNVEPLKSGEKDRSILEKISQMFRNVRYLFKVMGNTDISSIGGGTATGAINYLKQNLEIQSEKIGSLNADLAKQETEVSSNTSQISSNASAISTLNSDLSNLKFGVDSDGNYGYIKPGADTVTPFKDLTWGTPFKIHLNIPSDYFVKVTISFPIPPKIIAVQIPGQLGSHWPSWFAAVDLTNKQTTYFLQSATGYTGTGNGYSCDPDVYWAY